MNDLKTKEVSFEKLDFQRTKEMTKQIEFCLSEKRSDRRILVYAGEGHVSSNLQEELAGFSYIVLYDREIVFEPERDRKARIDAYYFGEMKRFFPLDITFASGEGF